MKHGATFLLALLTLATLAVAQENSRMYYDEKCGCDLLFVEGIQTTREGDRYGFRREDGTQITPNIYLFTGQFTNGYCKVMLDYGRTGLIDRDGNEVVPCIYDDVGFPSEGRVLVVKNNRYGYTDLQGREVIDLQYLRAGSFSDGCAPVLVIIDSFFSACTFIDTLGRQLYPAVYENLLPFSCGYAPVLRYERWGLIDRSGREVLPTVFEQLTPCFDSFFFAGESDALALYDHTLQPISQAVYSWTGGLSEERILVMRDGRYGYLDRRGTEVIPCTYDDASPFRYGRALVRQGNHYGIIDTAGRYVLPLEYENRVPYGDKYIYHDSLALVEKDGRVFFVDIDGRPAFPFTFEQAYHFSEGLASVKHNGMWGYIDVHGDVYMPFVFDLALPYQWGRAEVVYNGESRYVDRQGRCVKNCKGIVAWRDWSE